MDQHDQYVMPPGPDGTIRTPDDDDDEPRLTAAASLPSTPGLVITAPEQLGETSWLPYEKADRTPAGPLQMLEEFAAHRLKLPRDLLVSRYGQICDHGSVVLFARNAEPGALKPAGYVVASYDADSPVDESVADLATAAARLGARFRITERQTFGAAEIAYHNRIEELTA